MPGKVAKWCGLGRKTNLDVTVMSKKRMSCRAAKKIGKTTDPEVIVDCETLSKMQLRQRYSAEANAHRNMLSRQKTHGALIRPEFRDFANFLRHVGRIPARGATLDRVLNSDPEYGPGKVRWADKRTQNSNKSDTLLFHYSRTGETYTVFRLSKLQNVQPSTIRKRLERGWTDDEIIEGTRATIMSPSAPERSRSAGDIAFQRRADYCKWYRQEYGLEAIPASYEDVKEILSDELKDFTPEQYERYFTKRWPEYRPHMIFRNLPVSQQTLIEKIDPGYVTAILADEAQNRKSRKRL